MRHRRLKTYLLLGYLLLLWNVAPSAHHAEFLGLHADGCCSAGVCSHSHAPRSGEFARLDIAGDCDCKDHNAQHHPQDDVAIFDADTSCHDCLLCDFFDQLNAMASSVNVASRETPFHFYDAIVESIGSTNAINCSARGPPSLFAHRS